MIMTPASFEHVSPVWTRYTDFVVTHGEGSYLFARDGRRYLDFTCGIAVTNTGTHRARRRHPQQAGKLIHGQANLAMHEPMLALIDRCGRSSRRPGRFFFSNSGAEAIEGVEAGGRPPPSQCDRLPGSFTAARSGPCR
jgi:4-aminobutyrate aminotransferase